MASRGSDTVIWIINSGANIYTVGSQHRGLVRKLKKKHGKFEIAGGEIGTQAVLVSTPHGVKCGPYSEDAPCFMPMIEVIRHSGEFRWDEKGRQCRAEAPTGGT